MDKDKKFRAALFLIGILFLAGGLISIQYAVSPNMTVVTVLLVSAGTSLIIAPFLVKP